MATIISKIFSDTIAGLFPVFFLILLKVFSPHFHVMKCKIAYKKRRIGKVHFQKNRETLQCFTMKRERKGLLYYLLQANQKPMHLIYHLLPKSAAGKSLNFWEF